MKQLLTIAFLLFTIHLIAQEPPRNCLTPEKVKTAFEQNPALKARYESMQQLLNDRINDPSLRRTVPQQISIPVVVHIVLNPDAPGQYVTDEQVYSQIRVLNEDFRKRSGTLGYNNHPDGADTQINFRLASVDPQGNPTNGIVRVNIDKSSIDSDTEDDYMKSLSNWDADRYLNIWVANVTGGVLGYAYYPGTAPDGLDGVVILYTAFGTTGSARSPFDLGRTATHEVGHYLNLIHVWGDVDGCGGSDLVVDTPPCDGQYFSGNDNSACTKPVQCFGFARQTENYMDYSDDRCMNMFTNGQSVRMNTALRLFRPELMNIPQIEKTVGVDFLTVPDLFSGGTYAIKASVRNNGSDLMTIDSLHVQVIEDDFSVTFPADELELSAGESGELSFELTFETSGMKSLKVWPESMDDEFADDDTLQITITVVPNRPETVADFTAYSDYLTPESVNLSWTMPEKTVNGLPVEGTITGLLFRNDTLVTEFPGLVPGGNAQFTDEGLVTGETYIYRMTSTVSYLPDSADAETVQVIAGGSLVPAEPMLSVQTNGSVSRVVLQIPDVHNDQTPFHNPGFALLNRLPGGVVDSVLILPDQVGGIVRFYDIPVGKSTRNYRYSSFLTGSGNGYFISLESDAKVVRTGAYRSMPWADSLETTPADLLFDGGWMLVADPLNQKGSVLVSQEGNASGENLVVSPMIKVKDSIEISWMVNYVGEEPYGAVFRYSSDFGKSWVAVDTVKKSDLEDWVNGNPVWMKRVFRKNFGNGDTLVLSIAGLDGVLYADDFRVKAVESGVFVEPDQIQSFSLGNNYPNPFNPVSKIPVVLPERGMLQIRMTDILGREVVPVREVMLSSGEHLLTIDATTLSSGVYLYEVVFNNQRQSQLIQVVK